MKRSVDFPQFPTEIHSGGPNFPDAPESTVPQTEFVDLAQTLTKPLDHAKPEAMRDLLKKIEKLQETGFSLDDLLEDNLDLFSKEEQKLLELNYPKEVRDHNKAEYQKMLEDEDKKYTEHSAKILMAKRNIENLLNEELNEGAERLAS